MFAYCQNNSVNFYDPAGYFPHSQCTYAYIDGNYTLPYITDQDDDLIKSKRFGITTVSHGGCGPIATYNALISLGKYVSFDEVLAYYNSNIFALNLGGLTGTPVDLVAQYFRDNGYSVIVSDDPDEIDVLSMSADASILWYMFPAKYFGVEAYGAHFVSYKKTDAGYVGYNTAEGNGTYMFRYASDYGYDHDRYYAIGIFIFK